VLVLGDSNLFQSAAQVDAALRAAGFMPTLLGVPGYGLKDLDSFWLQKVPGLLAADPDIVVVGLATNDAINPIDVLAFPERLDRMMHALGERPVIWITHVDQHPGSPPAYGATNNDAIRAAVDRWPNLTVIDFAVEIANDPTILRYDAVHFSMKGMTIYASRIADTVAAALRVSGRG
jgi:lysophospholipase L1-like esterase